VQLIYARSTATPGPISQDALVRIYRHDPATEPGRVRLRTNFACTLDGSIMGADGRSGSINTPSDRVVFAVHRALADVIVVGAGTVRAEGYRAVDLAPWQRDLRAASALAPYPTLVIISASGQVDPAVATPLEGDGGPVMIMTRERAGGRLEEFRDTDVEVIRLPGEQLELRSAMSILADRGLTRVLCEGGPGLHRDLLAADLVDEVSLTIAPLMVAGDGARSTRGAFIPAAPRFVLQHAIHADDEALFTHYYRASPSVPGPQ
jgi:riboflavin-specific deaminase-like protein